MMMVKKFEYVIKGSGYYILDMTCLTVAFSLSHFILSLFTDTSIEMNKKPHSAQDDVNLVFKNYILLSFAQP